MRHKREMLTFYLTWVATWVALLCVMSREQYPYVALVGCVCAACFMLWCTGTDEVIKALLPTTYVVQIITALLALFMGQYLWTLCTLLMVAPTFLGLGRYGYGTQC